jgi:cell division protein FtsW
MLVVGLLVLMTIRGFRVATHARDSFGFLLAVGISCWLAYQALINIAVITAVIPFTGMPLPFLSYGGSSLLITLLGIGVLLNVSRDAALTGRQRRTKAE